MHFDSLHAWLSWLETLHPSEIDLGLERIGCVAQKMELAKPARFVLTVAGTNGKGSTVTFLSAILKQAGLRVGTYTSPHLICYNERVVINGQQASDAQLCQAFEKVEDARGDVSLTYFEFGTLAAFALFEKENLDVVVLEVGLGGRLDAVNLIDADVAVMTTIALDHEAWLGNTREAIGKEKAGIFRAHKPAVCGDKALPASVVETADQIGAVLYRREVDFCIKQHEAGWTWQGKNRQQQPVVLEQLPLPQLPIDNAATAIQAVMCLPIDIAHKAIYEGVQQAALVGRYQKINKDVMHILDVAHNPESAQYLAAKLQQDTVPGKTIAVFAMLSDKDCEQVVNILKTQIDVWYVAGIAVARGQTSQQLSDILAAAGVTQPFVCDTVLEAYRQAKQAARKQDRIVICGSFYTVGDVLAHIRNEGGSE